MLSHDSVVAHLVRRGLLADEDVVERELRVIDASRRNHNLRVLAAAGQSYLVKQGRRDGDGPGTVRYEAAVYEVLDRISGDAAAHVPRSFGCDARESILVLELIAEAENVRENVIRTGTAAGPIGAAIGDALGRVHARIENVAVPATGAMLVRRLPDVFAFTRPSLGMLYDTSAGNAALMRLVQHNRSLSDGLDALAEAWRPQILIHGDPRWENWLIERSDEGTPPRLVLIDWEFAGLGDPAWDVGSVLCEYLAYWVRSIPELPGTMPQRAMQHTDVPLERVQPVMRALWLAYARRRLPADLDEELTLVTRFAAAKLVQFAAEQAHTAASLTASTGALLQLAANIFADPACAARELVGVPSAAGVAA
jgi:aminoglycoside phosphotransferase (APT) family kinase protein